MSLSPGEPRAQLRLSGVLVACLSALLLPAGTAGAVEAGQLLERNGTCREPTTPGDPAPVFEPRKIMDLPGGGERIEYRCGPIRVTPGQNRIEWPFLSPDAHRPDRDGWITRIEPDLVTESGESLRSDKVMFHHGVWLNLDRRDSTATGQARFAERVFGAGEEKTTLDLPDGFGYRYEASDRWLLNHMLHNLVAQEFDLYIEYTIDFYPDGSEKARDMTQVRSIWMDVQNGSGYPVFDVWRGQGGRDGQFTYPDDLSESPYEGDARLNQWTVDRDGFLVWTAGHVHSGGLWTDLNLIRQGARYMGPQCSSKASRLAAVRRGLARVNRKISRLRSADAAKPRIKELNRKRIGLIAKKTRVEDALRTCRESQPRVQGNKVRLFRSDAEYFERNGKEIGPISWDMGMFSTTDDWRPQLRKGDTLQVTTTYETERGSWYESMGINFVYMADGEGGQDPFRERIDDRGERNHGPLPENQYHGGEAVPGAKDPRRLTANRVGGSLLIGDWSYQSSDFKLGQVAAVRQGETVTFQMSQPDIRDEIWHSLTSCDAPCNRATGISYPIPNGEFRFDSGQLGPGPGSGFITNGTIGRTTWDTPKDLPVGTHTFFCRIHPDMRGAIRVLPRN